MNLFRLGRHSNGVSNAISLYTDVLRADSDGLRQKFDEIASYALDWDDNGAPPLAPELIDCVRRLLFCDLLNILPNELSALPNGTFVLGWRDGSEYTEWEISRPFEAQEMVVSPGGPTEHRPIRWTPPERTNIRQDSYSSSLATSQQLAA